MILSMKWLSDYVDLNVTTKEFCDKMTLSGSKVEGFTSEGEEISNVVVGKILSIAKHPDADKLIVCKVDVGMENPIQIVTGATNVFEGALIPVALNNSKLPGGVSIKKGKLRGVLSEGMLCSLGELKLTVNDFPYAIEDGIFIIEEDCKIGQDIREAIKLDDTSIEFEITPNRSDCLSVMGIAREASATFDRPLNILKNNISHDENFDESILKVDVENTEYCKKYIAKIIKDVKIGPSPLWMRQRLRASGLRPINNIVDITNYVMLEYGQPVHAFDYDMISEKHILIRNAKDGERITLLDDSEKILTSDMLVIADDVNILAMAGIMGGKNSGITEETKTIIFEIANFDPSCIRRTSKKLGVRSESSFRFERGIDINLPEIVLNKVCQLVELLNAGKIITNLYKFNCDTNESRKIDFDPDWINNFLNLNIKSSQMIDILNSLGMIVENERVIIPSFRPDIEGKADIAEEIARIYGYDKIPTTIPILSSSDSLATRTPEQVFENKILETLVSQGCYEIKTYSFISPKYYDKVNLPIDSDLRNSVVISNPLGEDTSIMRTTAIPSMLEILSKNYNNRSLDCKLFELATEYHPSLVNNELPSESKSIIIGMYGNNIDFYDIKGIVENLTKALDVPDCDYIANQDFSIFHPGRTADIFLENVKIGTVGQIHPTVAKNYQIQREVFIASINVDALFENKISNKYYKPLPKYPSVTRDISLICDNDLPVMKIQKIIIDEAGKDLEKISLFDIYTGTQISEGKKSISYSLNFRNMNKTLTDMDIDIIIDKVLEKLKQFNIHIRTI